MLGILGVVFCQLTGPFAWVMGNNALAEIDANPMAYANRSTVQAGPLNGAAPQVAAARSSPRTRTTLLPGSPGAWSAAVVGRVLATASAGAGAEERSACIGR